MEIRQSRPGDLEAILGIYAGARAFMAASGNPHQWGQHYPPAALVEEDIARGRGYVCEDGGRVLAVFMFAVGDDPTYGRIEGGAWLSDRPYGVVHRIASSGAARGAAACCLDWCLERCGNLRIDTHRDNGPMLRLLDRLGFVRCGIIYLENGDERIAFQKVRPDSAAREVQKGK